MYITPIKYNEPLFRPPAEANSAIVQATLGCSWNKCAFCEMYSSKSFQVKKFAQLSDEIKLLAAFYQGRAKKIFLADGNAFVLSAKQLIPILNEINTHFDKTQRISSYALPSDILNKSLDELKEIRHLGLKLLYIGVESGDDELLKLINKSEDYASTKAGILKAHEAGIETSVMVLNGLGGKKYSTKHAINTAKLINETNPKLLSSLTLSLPFGLKHYQQKFKGEYTPQTIVELAEELMIFIENLDVKDVIFRSDHVSNNLVLKGVLGKDKEAILNLLQYAIVHIDDKEYPVTPVTL